MRFIAESLEDLARMFDKLAAETQKGAPPDRVAKGFAQGANYAYLDAAKILRNTTLQEGGE